VRKLAEPTYDVGVVADTATAMFHELDDSREVRLLGVRGEMVPPEGGY
jgi:DNA polymerase-4